MSTVQLILNIVRSGSLLTNLALSGYLFFLNDAVYDWFFYDSVQNISSDIFYKGGTNLLFGVILFSAIAGEFTAFLWKAKNGDIRRGSEAGGVFFLWVFHSVVSVIMVIVAFGAFGITFESKEYQWVLPVALFGTVIKEFFILVIIVGVEREEQVSAFKNHAADFLFVVFYSLAYTVVIGNILKPDDYNNYILVAHYSIPLMIMKTVLVVFIFLMLYLPLRIPYFLYEGYTDAKMKALSLLSIVLVAAGAVLPVFDGETSLKKALQYPERVEILFLNSSGIKTVPEEIKKFRNLKALHLGSNSIQNVPDWIVQFEKLEWINLGANSIAEFPEHLLDLPNVKKIELYYNKIKKMPGDLSGFKKLQYLNLRTNMMLPPEKARVAELLRKSEKNPSGILLDL